MVQIVQLVQTDNRVQRVKVDSFYKEMFAKLIAFRDILLNHRPMYVQLVRYLVKLVNLIPQHIH